jgi:hypothetical protein
VASNFWPSFFRDIQRPAKVGSCLPVLLSPTGMLREINTASVNLFSAGLPKVLKAFSSAGFYLPLSYYHQRLQERRYDVVDDLIEWHLKKYFHAFNGQF